GFCKSISEVEVSGNVVKDEGIGIDELPELVPLDIDVFNTGVQGGILGEVNTASAITKERGCSTWSKAKLGDEFIDEGTLGERDGTSGTVALDSNANAKMSLTEVGDLPFLSKLRFE
ncbi:hypothetical protein WOLCODRAFT_60737, partial [Wolfiporia cocos MD-104 SS10]